MRITLSSKQYTMLKEIRKHRVFSLEAAALYLQPTFTSMARRGYLTTDYDGDGNTVFLLGPQALSALVKFEADTILRANESSNLSAWLDNYVKRSQRRGIREAIKKAS